VDGHAFLSRAKPGFQVVRVVFRLEQTPLATCHRLVTCGADLVDLLQALRTRNSWREGQEQAVRSTCRKFVVTSFEAHSQRFLVVYHRGLLVVEPSRFANHKACICCLLQAPCEFVPLGLISTLHSSHSLSCLDSCLDLHPPKRILHTCIAACKTFRMRTSKQSTACRA
jgi:hypothetical protein